MHVLLAALRWRPAARRAFTVVRGETWEKPWVVRFCWPEEMEGSFWLRECYAVIRLLLRVT